MQLLKTFLNLWHKPGFHVLLASALCAFFALAYSVLMLNKYWQFEYFFVDNVYFHSALWKLANFQMPIVEHRMLGLINVFGDHFHPTIFLVALLFRIFPWHETVLISMAVAYALGGFFAFLIAQKVLRSRVIIYILLLAYFFYIATQNAFLFGFHEINLLAPFFFLAIWAVIGKKWWLYWLGLGLVLLTKESMAVIGVSMAIFIWFLGKEYRKVAVSTLIISVAWYLVATRLIIPHFSGGQFLYETHQLGLPNNPQELVKRFTYPPEKIETFTVSIFSFGFLPLLNIPALALVLQDFILRYVFAIPGNLQYLLTYHYGVALAPMLLLSSIWSVKWMEQRKWGVFVVSAFGLLTLVGTFYANYLMPQKAPFLLVTNKSFYDTTKSNAFLWPLVQAVPPTGKIMTQNHLGMPLSKQPVYLLGHNFRELVQVNPHYLVYDLRAGQNPNNFFPIDETKWREILYYATASGKYQESFHQGDMFVLKRVY